MPFLRRRDESENDENWGIIFEETVTFPVWLDLMKSAFVDVIGSRWFEVTSLDAELFVSVFAKTFSFENICLKTF